MPGSLPHSVEVVCASEVPIRHPPAASHIRLPGGGQPSVEVVCASELPSRHTPAAYRSQLPGLAPGRHGLAVKASVWPSLDRQLEPIFARLWWHLRRVTWDAVPKLMLEYISPDL